MSRKKKLIGAAVVLGAALAAAGVGKIAYTAGGFEPTGQMERFEFSSETGGRPGISWQTADGKTVALADFDGKTVLLNFWATWCAPCLRELPSLDRLAGNLKNTNIAVMAVNLDRSGAPVAQRLATKLKLENLVLYLDPKSKAARTLGVQQLPTTFVFDPAGGEVGKLEGAAEWDSPEARALLDHVAGTQPEKH